MTFLSVTLAHVILRLHVAREIFGFLSVTDTYIHTYKLFPRCDAELVASRLGTRQSVYSYISYPHTIHTAISQPHTCSDGLVCDEPFCKVISVSLHMSVITQYGYSALMMVVYDGKTEVVSMLLKAGANIDLQNKVKCQ